MAHNFKTQAFGGTLLDLFELCWEQMPNAETLAHAHEWVKQQIEVPDNLLPVRKFAPSHQLRGIITQEGNQSYIAVDNEPLAGLYKLWSQGSLTQDSIGSLLRTHVIPASWSCDVPNKERLRFSIVSSSIRDNGLKLAHITDAASSTTNMNWRYLRSISPLNVFVFPNSRQVNFKLNGGAAGWAPHMDDWGEDKWLRSLASSWLLSKLQDRSKLDLSWSEMPFNPDWQRAASGILLTVIPKMKKSRRAA